MSKAMEKKALLNFENFHKLRAGSATRDMLEKSEAGVKGWANSAEMLNKIIKGFQDPNKVVLDAKTRQQLLKTR